MLKTHFTEGLITELCSKRCEPNEWKKYQRTFDFKVLSNYLSICLDVNLKTLKEKVLYVLTIQMLVSRQDFIFIQT